MIIKKQDLNLKINIKNTMSLIKKLMTLFLNKLI